MGIHPKDSISDVPGILVGHATKPELGTGCTVVRCCQPAVVGVTISGGAPGTRETALCNPSCFVERANAILLAGGSAFGLAAADGVMEYMAEIGQGVPTPHRPIPIVPSAVIYDFNVGSSSAAPTARDGYEAARCASSTSICVGPVGAATGALVGKVRGPRFAMGGGVGTASIALPDGPVVGALAVVNSFGDVIDPATSSIVAGAKADNGEFLDTTKYLLSGNPPFSGFCQNTTLGVIATNCRLSKAETTRVAQIAQGGMARAIVPCGTNYDGDVVFALANGTTSADVNMVGVAAAWALTKAILRAVSLSKL